jgi:hypothetical protein
MEAMYGSIRIRGARKNNLKNVSLDIPKRRITVFTGVSGSGKSSLVFSTIAAESQRLINETYPAFVQQFMPHYGQPDADLLENISAAIIVDQQRLGGNLRSTVATVTDTSFDCRSRSFPSTCECCERLGSWNNELKRSGVSTETGAAHGARRMARSVPALLVKARRYPGATLGKDGEGTLCERKEKT